MPIFTLTNSEGSVQLNGDQLADLIDDGRDFFRLMALTRTREPQTLHLRVHERDRVEVQKVRVQFTN